VTCWLTFESKLDLNTDDQRRSCMQVAVRLLPYHEAPVVHWFEGFYRTGSFIFGGGQVGARAVLEA